MLEITGIRKSFAKPVLKGVSLSVDTGSCVLLMGPNGSGKTTLLKIIAGLVLPDEGRVLIDGDDAARPVSSIRKSMGFAFSGERSFYQRLSGIYNLRFFSRFCGMTASDFGRRLAHYLNELDMPAGLLERPVMEYSSGEKQALSLIRALIHDPEYLFIDEFSISLDDKRQAAITSLLGKEIKGRKAAIIVTHSPGEAANLPGNAVFLKEGAISHDKT